MILKMLSGVREWATVTTIGVAFGYAMNRGQVHIPDVITDQFSLSRFIMMKMFLSAMGTSMLSFSFVGAIHPEKMEKIRGRSNPNSVGKLVLGGGLLGMGMAIGGSCPGTQYVQLGAGMGSAVFALVGSELGVFAFAKVQHYLTFLPLSKVMVKSKLDGILKVRSWKLQFVLGAMFISLASFLDRVVPWQSESAFQGNGFWNPIVAGICVGLLQIPGSFILESVLGSSSSYVVTFCSLLHIGTPKSKLLEEIKKDCGGVCGNFDDFSLSRVWQVIFALSAVIGSAIAQQSTHSQAMISPTPVAALLGGFLVLFGARTAGGCTSGHGISGSSLLNLTSWTAIASMFASGILTKSIIG